ncbi:chromate transporter [Pseudobacillus wudalianchiensis]|uniref:Chromate transporter n=1 Tax=Pseudobacillus wudalianchiensis TaxID=1743143 RepID=A0A1B9ATG0_9BACI|nr:chromate transporter [Bacillus wudalianchiensis]OCA87172.1 chromate transporter [Bacillus wudalianchiensis]
MNKKWKLLAEIFFTFFKIGPVTFGGGYAMIPLIEKEVVTKKKWMQTNDITDVVALAGSAPGAMAINSATFVGYRIAGVSGAIAAMIGILLPTFLIVVGLSIFYLYFNDNPKIEAAFHGIGPAVVALICLAAYKLAPTAIIDKTTLVIASIAVLLLFFLHIHPVVMILGGIAAGICLVKIRTWLGYKTKLDGLKQKVG